MNLLQLYRDGAYRLVCHDCRKFHPVRPADDAHLKQCFEDFRSRHAGHHVVLLTPGQVESLARRVERRRRVRRESVLNYAHNASVLTAYQASDQSMTVTNLASLASSPTAGWSSGWIDNTSNLYLDYLVYVLIAAVNTAPGNNKAFYVYTAGNLNTTDLPTTGAGSGNTVANGASSSTDALLTFADVTANAQTLNTYGVVPYTATNKAVVAPLGSLARVYGGVMYPFTWLAMVNYSGITLGASGNAVKYRGVYATVA